MDVSVTINEKTTIAMISSTHLICGMSMMKAKMVDGNLSRDLMNGFRFSMKQQKGVLFVYNADHVFLKTLDVAEAATSRIGTNLIALDCSLYNEVTKFNFSADKSSLPSTLP